MTAWGDEERKLTLDLWAKGLSAGQISQRLRGRSRNAVIGVVHRAGAAGRAPPSAPKAPRPAPKPELSGAQRRKANNLVAVNMPRKEIRDQARAFGETRVKPTLIIVGAGDGTAVIEKPPDQAPRAKIGAHAWKPLEGSSPVSLMHLAAGHCKWPVELAGETEAHFCGMGTEETYCASHRHAESERSKAQNGTKAKPSANELARSLRRYVA